MAAVAQGGAAGLAASSAAPSAGYTRQRKRGSSSRAAQALEATGSEIGGQAVNRSSRKGKEDVSPAASGEAGSQDLKHVTSTPSLAAITQRLGEIRGSSSTPKRDWSAWFHEWTQAGLLSRPGALELPRASVASTLRSPLVSTLIVIAVAGLITSYLVDWTTRRQVSGFNEANSEDWTTLQNKLESVEKIVRMQGVGLETANKRVDKLEEKQSQSEGAVRQKLDQLGGDVDGLKHKLDNLDPDLKSLIASGGELLKKELESLLELTALSIDDVRKAVQSALEEELARLAADGTAMPDYALGSGGGRVLDHSEAIYGEGWSLVKLRRLVEKVSLHPMARKVLEPSAGVPGHCLPLKGTNGSIDIALRTTILPSDVTLEHIAESVSYEISSAPWEFRVFGWEQPSTASRLPDRLVPKLLGKFAYEIKKTKHIQTFKLWPEALVKINAVRLEILSNHGHPNHTCIYRFRVHGSPVRHLAASSSGPNGADRESSS